MTESTRSALHGPSRHLTWTELACHDAARTPYPARWRESRAVVLAQEFEEIRRRSGNHPIRVLSAYRTPEHNRAVGGSRSSQHVEGRALDLAPPRGWDLDKFFAVVLAWARDERSAIHGLARYPWGVHFDIRPGPRLVRWEGRRAWAEAKPRGLA